MPTVDEARVILRSLGLPIPQQNEMSALTLLALCGVGPDDRWNQAHRHRVTVTKGIMAFVRDVYGKEYAPNTRETFRRQVLHQFVQARIADYNPFEPNLPTNSPKAHYAITEAALVAVQAYGTDRWDDAVREFIEQHGSLLIIYQRERASQSISVRLPDGSALQLSPGKHNSLQRAVIEAFRPRFAPTSALLYLGDTAQKNLVMDASRLLSLNIPFTEHDKLPDVVLYDAARNWLFLIEVVTSHGPMTPKRVLELEMMLASSPAGRVFVTAFADLAEFRKHLRTIAWETEVWIADTPNHLIHFNGDRFLGPRT